MLRAAAVIGKVFEFDELAPRATAHEDALLDALDEAVAAQLSSRAASETFAFTHDKIREVLYEELNPIRRRRLHLRIAEGLERCRDRRHVPATLAHHFIEAGDHDRGLAVRERGRGRGAERRSPTTRPSPPTAGRSSAPSRSGSPTSSRPSRSRSDGSS